MERRCPTCGDRLVRRSQERPSAYERRRYCSRPCALVVAHKAQSVDNSPWVCECDHPAADGLGECADCHRLVMSHSRHEGRPPVSVHPVNVCDVVPGEAFWDARDRCYYLIDAAPIPPADAQLVAITVQGEGVQDYDRRHTLLVADNTAAAIEWNIREQAA